MPMLPRTTPGATLAKRRVCGPYRPSSSTSVQVSRDGSRIGPSKQGLFGLMQMRLPSDTIVGSGPCSCIGACKVKGGSQGSYRRHAAQKLRTWGIMQAFAQL